MTHHHQHSHHAPMAHSMNGVFVLCIALNLLFVAVEAGVGFWQHSLSLLADAGHNLSDVFSLVLVLVAFHLAKIHPNAHYTYGYKKSTILISLLNALILLVAVGGILWESIRKFEHPVPVDGAAVSWTAFVGILINGLTAALLMRGSKQDLNVRGAFLHMVMDTLVSVGVVVSGFIITRTGWYIVDPIVGILIVCVIMVSTWHVLSDSLRLSLDGLPEGIQLEQIETILQSHPLVKDIHHVHVWAISTTDNALTAHVVTDHPAQWEEIKQSLKHALQEQGISHSTLEMESSSSSCPHEGCC